jgi:hypothetical protein
MHPNTNDSIVQYNIVQYSIVDSSLIEVCSLPHARFTKSIHSQIDEPHNYQHKTKTMLFTIMSQTMQVDFGLSFGEIKKKEIFLNKERN